MGRRVAQKNVKKVCATQGTGCVEYVKGHILMKQINKISTFLAAMAVTLSFSTAVIQVAAACGSYGPPTAEDRVEGLVYSTHWNAEKDKGEDTRTRIIVDSIEVTADRVATVKARIVSIKDKSATEVQYSLYKYDGRWKIAKNDAFKLAIASLKHALDANVQATLNEPHDAVEFAAVDLQRPLHSFASFSK